MEYDDKNILVSLEQGFSTFFHRRALEQFYLLPASRGIKCLLELPQLINMLKSTPISKQHHSACEHQVENPTLEDSTG
jgi:hypothetical protein